MTPFETWSSKPTLVAQDGLLEEAIDVVEMDAIDSSVTLWENQRIHMCIL